MKVRESLVFFGIVGVLVVASVAVLAVSSEVQAFDPEPAPSAFDPVEPPDEPRPPAPKVVAQVTPDAPERQLHMVDGDSLDGGIIDGSVLLAAGVAGRIDDFWVRVEELVADGAPVFDLGRPPFRRNFPGRLDPSRSPQRFSAQVPFSPYGYRVTVQARGCNGSSTIVQVTEESTYPQASLVLTPGRLVTVRLTDQYRYPCTARQVRLLPVGGPERPIRDATTDAYGSALFEDVLAGDYEVVLDNRAYDTITVSAPGYSEDVLGVGHASYQVEVPTGPTVRVEVVGPAGYGLADVDLRLYAVDTTENRRIEGVTDVGGICEFAHVLPGRYQLDAFARGHGSRSLKLEVTEEPPEPVRVRMVPQ